MNGSAPHRTKTTRRLAKAGRGGGGGVQAIRREGCLEKFQYYFVSSNCSIGIF